MATLADYGMINNAYQGENVPLISEQDKQKSALTLESLAQGNQLQKQNIGINQQGIDDQAAVRDSVNKNTHTDTQGNPIIDHASVANDLIAQGKGKLANDYHAGVVADQQAKAHQTLASNIEQAKQVAQVLIGVEAMPPEQRPAAYAQARSQYAASGHDVSQVPEQYDQGQVTRLIQGVQSADEYLKQRDVMQKENAGNKNKIDVENIKAKTEIDNADTRYGTGGNGFRLGASQGEILIGQIEKGLVDPNKMTSAQKNSITLAMAARQNGQPQQNDQSNPQSPQDKPFDMAKNQQDWLSRTNTTNSFTKGTDSKAILSLNTAADHLVTAKEAIAGLNNGDITLLNKAKNYYQQQTGTSAPTEADAVMKFVGDELAKAGQGGGSTALGDRESLKKTLNTSLAGGTLNKVLEQYQNLIGGKFNALDQKYKSGMKNSNASLVDDNYLTDAAKEAFINHGKVGAPAQQAPLQYTSKSGNKITFMVE